MSQVLPRNQPSAYKRKSITEQGKARTISKHVNQHKSNIKIKCPGHLSYFRRSGAAAAEALAAPLLPGAGRCYNSDRFSVTGEWKPGEMWCGPTFSSQWGVVHCEAAGDDGAGWFYCSSEHIYSEPWVLITSSDSRHPHHLFQQVKLKPVQTILLFSRVATQKRVEVWSGGPRLLQSSAYIWDFCRFQNFLTSLCPHSVTTMTLWAASCHTRQPKLCKTWNNGFQRAFSRN